MAETVYRMPLQGGGYFHFTYWNASPTGEIETMYPLDAEHLTIGQHFSPPEGEETPWVYRFTTGATVTVTGTPPWSLGAVIQNAQGWSYWPSGTAVMNNYIGCTANGKVFKYELMNTQEQAFRLLGDFQQWFGGLPEAYTPGEEEDWDRTCFLQGFLTGRRLGYRQTGPVSTGIGTAVSGGAFDKQAFLAGLAAGRCVRPRYH